MAVVEMNDMDAVRAYIRELRIGREMSQDDLGSVIGLSRQALNEWEKGRTYDLKGSSLLKAVEYLRGSFVDLGLLANASIERGIELARERLKAPGVVLTPEQQHRFTVEVEEIVGEEDLEEAILLLQDLKRKQKDDAWFDFGRFLKNDSSGQ